MATKTGGTFVPTDHLTGTMHGKRFTVVKDDVKLQDKWDAAMLPILEQDGLGKAITDDGVIKFTFRDAAQSTIVFEPASGHLSVASFLVFSDGKETA